MLSMLNRALFGAALTGLLMATPALAQDAATRIAVCNPAKVFEALEERKVVQERLIQERDRSKAEAARRQAEVRELMQQREQLNPTSTVYAEKNQQIMGKTVEYEVWGRLAEASLARQEKDQIIAIYDKIREACKEVATAERFDLVVAERRPEIPANRDQLTPDQVRQLITASDVLYSNEKVDITQKVILNLNKKFGTTGTTVPATGTGAGTPPKNP